MASFFLVFLINQFIEFEILKSLVNRWKLQNRLTFYKKMLIFGLIFGIILGTNLIFCYTKPESKFDQFNVPRHFTTSQLKGSYQALVKKYHSDKQSSNAEKNNDKFIEIKNNYKFLQMEEMVMIYDKLGEIKLPQIDQKLQDQILQVEVENRTSFKSYETLMLFFVSIIFGIILTYEDDMQPSRKYIILVNLIFFGMEYKVYYYDDLFKNTFYDIVFPRLAIFEIIQLQRLLIGSFIVLVRIQAYLNAKQREQYIAAYFTKIQPEIEKIDYKAEDKTGESTEILQRITRSVIYYTNELKPIIEKYDAKHQKGQSRANKFKYVYFVVVALLISSQYWAR